MAEEKKELVHHSYGSKHAALVISAQGADPILHVATGAMIGRKKGLAAEFGVLGDEQIIRDEEGIEIASAASIRGFFWNSFHAQKENKWTDEETQSVIDQVEFFCETQKDLVWRLEPVKLQAPWPTFDVQPDKNAVAVAIEIGQVQEALEYARQQGRKKVVTELEAHLAEQAAEAEAEQALTV